MYLGWVCGCVGQKTNIKNETRGGGSSETFLWIFIFVFAKAGKGRQRQAKAFNYIPSRCFRLRRQI
jgi:hypothetical protein